MECLWYTFCIHSHTCPSDCPSLPLGDILPELCSNNHWFPSRLLQYLLCLNSVSFCSLVCVQYKTRKRKSVKNGEGLVSSITWVMSVDVVGGANIQICNKWTPKASFLPVKVSSFDHANVCGIALERMIQWVVFAVGPFPLTSFCHTRSQAFVCLVSLPTLVASDTYLPRIQSC